jgi:hypothetical protein
MRRVGDACAAAPNLCCEACCNLRCGIYECVHWTSRPIRGRSPCYQLVSCFMVAQTVPTEKLTCGWFSQNKLWLAYREDMNPLSPAQNLKELIEAIAVVNPWGESRIMKKPVMFQLCLRQLTTSPNRLVGPLNQHPFGWQATRGKSWEIIPVVTPSTVFQSAT